jgi:hypothetical protein
LVVVELVEQEAVVEVLEAIVLLVMDLPLYKEPLHSQVKVLLL